MISVKKYLRISLLSIGIALLSSTAAIVHAQSGGGEQIADDCEQRAVMVNNRSKLLSALERGEEQTYKYNRAQWSDRISYASQWVPKDAQKAADTLYTYDTLHKNIVNELNKQIESSKQYEDNPLDCSDSNKSALDKALHDIKGYDKGKITGGQALIRQYKKEENDFLQKDFKKTTDKMIANLHKTKNKKPAPFNNKLNVRSTE